MARGTSSAIIVRRTATIAIAAAAAAALAACGAGQVTQTDQKQTAIAGVNVDSPSGDLALRDLQVEFETSEGYKAGDPVPLRVWISNETGEAINLTGAWIGDSEQPPPEDQLPAVTVVPADADLEAVEEPAETEAPADEETTEDTDGEAAEDEAGDEPTDGETETPAEDEQATEEPAEDEAALIGSADIGVEIAPRGYVSLNRAAGEEYLILEGLEEALTSGQHITVTFEFDNGDTVPVNIPVGQALDGDSDDFEYQENPGAGGH